MNLLTDGLTILRRNLIQLKRVPDLILFTLFQPIMFIVLFGYVFGAAIGGGDGANYRSFLIAGIFAQTIVFGATITGAGLADDMQKGVIDRFRTLPMHPSSVLVGRTLSDVVNNVIVLVVMPERLVLHHRHESTKVRRRRQTGSREPRRKMSPRPSTSGTRARAGHAAVATSTVCSSSPHPCGARISTPSPTFHRGEQSARSSKPRGLPCGAGTQFDARSQMLYHPCGFVSFFSNDVKFHATFVYAGRPRHVPSLAVMYAFCRGRSTIESEFSPFSAMPVARATWPPQLLHTTSVTNIVWCDVMANVDGLTLPMPSAMTGLPGVRERVMRLIPLEVWEGVTMKPCPPGEKVQPRAKSACPPAPDQYRPAIVSEAACP